MYYTIIDFETTGLSYISEQVIEIGAIKVNSEFKEVARLHTMVQLTKGKELPEFITKLTGITEGHTESGIPEAVALNMLKDFIGESIVVAQFAPFDLSYLSKALEPKAFIDTRSLSRLLNPNEKAGLKDICVRYGVTLEGHHRSINDCEATLKVLEIMVDRLEAHPHYAWANDLSYVNMVIEAPDRPLSFIPKNAKVIQLEELQK